MLQAPVTPATLIVFGLILAALLLFVTEAIPSDTTALAVLVSLVVLEPWTQVGARDAISGFASPATITIVAMYMLSEGVQRTGLVDRLGLYLARLTRGSETRLLGATVGTTGLAAGIVNNTPIVAVFVPMITGLAEDSRISPSKLLLPLSYAAMLGGTLTLIGTATNVLASDLSRQLLGRPLSMFDFTAVGFAAFVAGVAYLLTVGRWLTPARIDPSADLTEEFDLEDHLGLLRVREDSPLVDLSVAAAGERIDEVAESHVDLLQVERDGETFLAARSDQRLQVGDTLTVRANRRAVTRVAEDLVLRHLPRADVTALALGDDERSGTLVEAVIPPDSRFVGQTPPETGLAGQFDTTVLAVRRGDELEREGLDERTLAAGDTLLLQTTTEAVAFLREGGDLLVSQVVGASPAAPDESPAAAAPVTREAPLAVGIVAAVVAVAAAGLLPIAVAALGGVVAMVVTGCLTPSDAYDAVSWNVIFLLAGVIPLGLAMQRTGGAEVLAGLLVASADVFPLLAVLGLVYLLTGVLASVVTPVASVVLLIPIAVDTAARVGANELAFLLAVAYGGSSAFATPVGYQTNLMVYGPGGYRFTDYLRVGGPLQLLTALVTTLALAVVYGVR